MHKELGPGFVESVYDNALAIELRRRDIPFQRQLYVPVFYRDVQVGEHRLDDFVAERIVVELKAAKDITDLHFAVVRSYLRAAKGEHALILNFLMSVAFATLIQGITRPRFASGAQSAKLTLEVKRVHAS